MPWGLQTFTIPTHQLFSNLEELFPSELDQLSLETLSIRGTPPNAPHRTVNASPSALPSLASSPTSLPRMSNLKHLTIRFGIRAPKGVVHLDQIWHTLKASGTRLVTISLNYGVSSALMGYLSSYEGLERGIFNIRVLPSGNSLSSPSFMDAIRQHTSSLSVLKISPINHWTFAHDWREDMALNPTTWPVPSSFSRLRHLNLVSPLTWVLNTENFQRMLNYTQEMQELKKLTVDWYNRSVDIENVDNTMERIAEKVLIKRSNLERIRLRSRPYRPTTWRWHIQFPPMAAKGREESFKLSSFSHRSVDRVEASSEEEP
ncbi:hypothetical protein AX16_006148 [Volvariella volvacea WC 439]|nr:hypothetical protein AX16_006148 [Volvariella volvacea WC 439]